MKKFGIFSIVAGALFFSSFARAYPIAFTADLSPEVLGATGSGSVWLEFDIEAHTLGINANWSGLSGTTTVAHIHCCTDTPGTGTVGVAVTPGTLPGFPVGTQAGSYSIVLDMTLGSNYTAGFLNNAVFGGGGSIPGAEAALLAGIKAGTAYFNVHTTNFPAGEIRGFPQAVPEPMTLSLLALALIGVALVQRRKTGLKVKV